MDIRQSYREAAARGANPIQLVVRLYEQLVEDLRQVAIAMEQQDIRGRTDRIKHAILVVGHLQSGLDFDKGGTVARNLEEFYNFLRQNLVKVQFSPSKAGVQQLIIDVMAVRSSWVEVERIEGGRSAGLEAPHLQHLSPGDSGLERVRVDWEG